MKTGFHAMYPTTSASVPVNRTSRQAMISFDCPILCCSDSNSQKTQSSGTDVYRPAEHNGRMSPIKTPLRLYSLLLVIVAVPGSTSPMRRMIALHCNNNRDVKI